MTARTLPDISRHVPALDGMRAGAVLLVILSHFGLDNIIPGGFGVTVFFWISGFLITTQLTNELEQTQRIDYLRFYQRRVLRLMPAAIVYTTIAGVTFVLAGGAITPGGWLAAYFYGVNYYDLFIGYPPLASGVENPLTHLWSLAVEEHYYIIWPLALAILYRHRWAVRAVLAVCVIVLLWRVQMFQSCFTTPPEPSAGPMVCYRIYKGTDTRLDSIAWGALVAVLAASSWRAQLERLLGSNLLRGLSMMVVLLSFLLRGTEFREVWRYSLQGIALSVAIPMACCAATPLRRLLEMPVLVLIGRLSYSLYLWHWGALCFATWMAPDDLAAKVMWATGVTVGGALFSYYGVERPMIAFRRRVGSQASAGLVPAA